MSRAKLRSDVDNNRDMSNPNYRRICRPDRSVWAGAQEVDHKFISLRSFAMDRKLQIFFGYSKNIKESLHRVKFLYEKTERWEKYRAMKNLLIFANTICICLSGLFTLSRCMLRCARNNLSSCHWLLTFTRLP